MRNENLNLSTKSEIADLRMRLAHQALEGGEKLRIYEKIYEKSLTLTEYVQKNEDIKNIVELAINEEKYEKVHQYCKKTYEDVDLDPRTKADLLYQESLAFVAESKLHKAFNRCFESYKINRDPKTLSELQIILTKSLEELPVVARTKVEMATSSLNREDPNFVKINLLYKKIKVLKDLEPNFSMRSLEANSLLPNSRSRIEPTAEVAPRVTGAEAYFGREARTRVPHQPPTTRVTANLGFSQPEGQRERENIQEIPRRNIREAPQAQQAQQAQEIQEEPPTNLSNHQFSMIPEQPVLTQEQRVQDLIESQSSLQQQTTKKDSESESDISDDESEISSEEDGYAEQDGAKGGNETKGKRTKDGKVKKMIEFLENSQRELAENLRKEFKNLSEEQRKEKQEEIDALALSIKGLKDDNIKLKGRMLRVEGDVGNLKDDFRDLEKIS
jgi:hypothetical protein